MSPSQQMTLQIVTLGTAALVAIVAVIVAGQVARSKGGPWWAVLGGLLICGGTVSVAYQMFMSARYSGWRL